MKKISTEDQDTEAEDQMWVKSSEEQNKTVFKKEKSLVWNRN